MFYIFCKQITYVSKHKKFIQKHENLFSEALKFLSNYIEENFEKHFKNKNVSIDIFSYSLSQEAFFITRLKSFINIINKKVSTIVLKNASRNVLKHLSIHLSSESLKMNFESFLRNKSINID